MRGLPRGHKIDMGEAEFCTRLLCNDEMTDVWRIKGPAQNTDTHDGLDCASLQMVD
jgi:hypothetical protein